MTVGDIYSVEANTSCPKSEASFKLYYRETVAFDFFSTGTEGVANAWASALPLLLIAMLSSDYRVASVLARKVFQDKEPKWRADITAGAGTRVGPGLPANNAMVLGLGQTQFSNRSNGRIFIAGIAEGDSTVGVLTSAFITGPFTTFRDELLNDLSEDSPGLGVWEPGIISTKVLDANPPTKDWEAAFAPLVTAIPQAIIGTQRRRTTPVRGAFL